MNELNEDAQLFKGVTKMLSPTANTVAFKEHIEATVYFNIPIDTCNSLESYVDYLAATIAEAPTSSSSHDRKEGFHLELGSQGAALPQKAPQETVHHNKRS